MSSNLAHQRVLRTVRLLPQAVKIGILESEIKQEGTKPEARSPRVGLEKDRDKDRSEVKSEVQVRMPERNVKEIEELTAQIVALTNSLSNAEVANAELSESKAKLDREIDGIRSDYENRKRTLEAEANANAQRIADEARDKAKREGFAQGHTEGLEKARKEIEQEYHDKFAALTGVIENLGKNLEANFAELVKLNQPRLIRVWTEMLRRMLHRQIELNPDTIDTVLTELLSRLSDKNQVLIYVSPEDQKHLEGELDPKLQEILRGVKKLEIKSDPNVEQGSCIIETGLGVYDARWRTQMGQVESVIDDIFQQVKS